MDTMSKVVNMESIAVSGSQLFLSSPNNLFSVSKPSYFPLTSLPTKLPKFVHLKASSTLTCDDQGINRTFKKLQPSPWTDQFHSVSIDVSEMDALRKEIDVLKPKVKKTLMSNQGIDTTKKRILMIHLLRSLGLEYHFKEEIDETLKEGFEKIKEMMADEEDLYTVSIIFWVFRSYGHNISSDVFRRFKGIDGNFKESLKGDAKGILSLYEAGHLRTTKDYILDEALSFASSHLESMDSCGTCPTHLAIRIRNALTLSQHWNMEIVATVEYIPSYEQEKDHDEMLLIFAKISLKLVQLQYLHDLKIVTKWYKEQEFASKFPPFFRDKIVENYFFVLGVFFERQHSRARIMCTQCFTLFEIIDDTFDRYASLSEAESLANSLERWAPDRDMDKQPGYLKLVLNFIFDTFQEFERVLRPEGECYIVKATIEEFKTYAKAQRGFAKWVHTAHVPSFAEYMEIGVVEDAAYAAIACYFMCLGKLATKEAYEWLESRPKLVQSITIKLRLVNDIYGFEDDMDRGCVPNAVYCYMKQYGVTKQEAVTELHKMVIDADKEINEELLTTRGVSRLVLNVAMNFSKMITLCYNGYEGFTDPEKKIKEYMTSILVDLIRL